MSWGGDVMRRAEAVEVAVEGVDLAVFDVDHTIVDGASGLLFAYHMVRRGDLRWARLAVGAYWVAAHRLGVIDAEASLEEAAAEFRGLTRERLERLTDESFQRYVRPRIYVASREILERYRARGVRVLLLSGSGETMVERVARDLEVEEFIGNRFEWEDGRVTGRMQRPFVYGAGKRVLLEEYCAARGIAPARCAAFADSQSDLPLLTSVGFPHAVNPDWKLRRVARRRGWPILRFRATEGRKGIPSDL